MTCDLLLGGWDEGEGRGSGREDCTGTVEMGSLQARRLFVWRGRRYGVRASIKGVVFLCK